MKINLFGAIRYWKAMGSKAQGGKLISILFGEQWWPGDAEPGNDPHPGGTDTIPTDPQKPPLPVVVPEPLNRLQADEVWGYFVLCGRYDVGEQKRNAILQQFSGIQLSPWAQRRSETDSFDVMLERAKAVLDVTGDRPIYLGFDWFEAAEGGYPNTPLDKNEWNRRWLRLLAPYWDRVRIVEICDEPDDKETLQRAINDYEEMLRSLNLVAKPTAITICTHPAKFKGVQGLSILRAELYSQNIKEDCLSPKEVSAGKIRLHANYMVNEIEAAGFRAGIVLQVYARNYSDPPIWGMFNKQTFAAQLTEGCKWVLENRDRLADVGLFSAGRPSGFCSDGEAREDQAAYSVWDVAWPILKTFASQLRGEVAEWPKLPNNPMPGLPVKLEIDRNGQYVGQAGDAGATNVPRRWGLCMFRAIPVDARGVRYVGIWEQLLPKRIVSWFAAGTDNKRAVADTTKKTQASEGGWFLSLQHAWETMGWKVALVFRTAPSGNPLDAFDLVRDKRPERDAPAIGTQIAVTASCYWPDGKELKTIVGNTVTTAPISPATYIDHGLCSAGCGKGRQKNVLICDQGGNRGLGICSKCAAALTVSCD